MTPDQPYEYAGSELDLFSGATNWRGYWAEQVRPHLGQRVLEVGAGIGTVTRALQQVGQSWTAVEPDPALAERIVQGGGAGSQVNVVVGSIDDTPADAEFDSILYIDVLEHIEDDRTEVEKAYKRLAPGGRLVILAPAHQWLFTPFDASIGHYRRYDLKALRAIKPKGAAEVRAAYLDTAGILASAANRLLLRTATPTREQIALWDTRLVPLSRRLDALLGYRAGKSVLMVWGRP